ncbi:urease accessory protein UreF [Brachybacterium vulturis]|uniref:Urease accessory protein UreF n=1 Tax=Brachybacterium vulturis TaxID=2017484 RepID=A0A291GJN7_9MICO|nr:urease accessory UreF family protein [Brachybacterium vulturis]ATG50266.1 urease accessory protein UreF [Brachybacterium vulturis]
MPGTSTTSAAASRTAALLLLGDGRLPAGGYAHSAGLEQAIARGWVRDAADIADHLRGRIHTTGLVSASFAAAAQHRTRLALGAGDLTGLRAQLTELDRELIARTPSPALRKIGQDLGRMLLRAMRSIVPEQAAVLAAAGPVLQQPIAYGVVAAALGLDARDAAGVVLYDSAATPAVAAVKLMSIDPFATHRCLAELAPDLDRLAERAAAHAASDPRELPSHAAPLTDIAAELHSHHDQRLFAS